jgi:hypothetical protein
VCDAAHIRVRFPALDESPCSADWGGFDVPATQPDQCRPVAEHRAEKWNPALGKSDAETKRKSKLPDCEIGKFAFRPGGKGGSDRPNREKLAASTGAPADACTGTDYRMKS